MNGKKTGITITAVLALAIALGVAVGVGAQGFTQVVALVRGQSALVTCDGANRLRADRQSDLIMALSCGRVEPAQPTVTPVTPDPTDTPAPDTTDMTWHPAGAAHGDRPAHEHGDPVPQWVADAGYMPMFTHGAGTPGENFPYYKHTAFKQWAGRFGNVDWFGVFHLDTSPAGQSGRFHSYQLWMRDPTGAVSHLHGWLDFGVGNNTGSQRVVVCGQDSGIRPIIMVNEGPGCRVMFENWYARAGVGDGWAPDIGFNINPTFYASGDPADPATWTPIDGYANNVTRRIEFAWYRERAQAAGAPFGAPFWATQWGERVSGADAPVCGTQRAIGDRTYTVQCLEQYIAATLPSVQFPGNAEQREFPSEGVQLPN
jgi:hypothetical protein